MESHGRCITRLSLEEHAVPVDAGEKDEVEHGGGADAVDEAPPEADETPVEMKGKEKAKRHGDGKKTKEGGEGGGMGTAGSTEKRSSHLVESIRKMDESSHREKRSSQVDDSSIGGEEYG